MPSYEAQKFLLQFIWSQEYTLNSEKFSGQMINKNIAFYITTCNL